MLEGLLVFQILSEMFQRYMISNYVLSFISTFGSGLHEDRSRPPEVYFFSWPKNASDCAVVQINTFSPIAISGMCSIGGLYVTVVLKFERRWNTERRNVETEQDRGSEFYNLSPLASRRFHIQKSGRIWPLLF